MPLGKIFRKSRLEKDERSDGGLSITYLKAMPLRDLRDINVVKMEVNSGKILILKITILAEKSIENVKLAVDELCEFVESIDGDIARLGEERIVICPSNVKVWREKTPVSNEPITTTA